MSYLPVEAVFSSSVYRNTRYNTFCGGGLLYLSIIATLLLFPYVHKFIKFIFFISIFIF